MPSTQCASPQPLHCYTDCDVIIIFCRTTFSRYISSTSNRKMNGARLARCSVGAATAVVVSSRTLHHPGTNLPPPAQVCRDGWPAPADLTSQHQRAACGYGVLLPFCTTATFSRQVFSIVTLVESSVKSSASGSTALCVRQRSLMAWRRLAHQRKLRQSTCQRLGCC